MSTLIPIDHEHNLNKEIKSPKSAATLEVGDDEFIAAFSPGKLNRTGGGMEYAHG